MERGVAPTLKTTSRERLSDVKSCRKKDQAASKREPSSLTVWNATDHDRVRAQKESDLSVPCHSSLAGAGRGQRKGFHSPPKHCRGHGKSHSNIATSLRKLLGSTYHLIFLSSMACMPDLPRTEGVKGSRYGNDSRIGELTFLFVVFTLPERTRIKT